MTNTNARLSEYDVPASPGASSPNDPVFDRIPKAELERRWALVRRHMAEHDLDVLIAGGFDDSLSGYVRWFCDFGSQAYMKIVLFFREGPMTTIEHGALGGHREPSPDSPGVAAICTTASFKSIAATFTYEAEIAVTELKRRGLKHIGLLRPGGLPYALVDHLQRSLPNVKVSDQTDALDRLKAIKGPAELDSLRQACRLQDEVFAKVLDAVRPGVREVELLALAEHELRLRGAIDGTMLSGSAPRDKPALPRPWRAQNRVLQKGDTFTILIEMSDALGYYGELARQVVLGRPSSEMQDAFGVVLEAQAAAVNRLRPGVACADLAAAHDEFMRARGTHPETRVFSHGQGYDLVERPLIRADETMTLEANMFLACHPAIATPSIFAFICDNYIVRASGPAERVHATPQILFEV